MYNILVSFEVTKEENIWPRDIKTQFNEMWVPWIWVVKISPIYHISMDMRHVWEEESTSTSELNLIYVSENCNACSEFLRLNNYW
jgi:hypothetical protein